MRVDSIFLLLIFFFAGFFIGQSGGETAAPKINHENNSTHKLDSAKIEHLKQAIHTEDIIINKLKRRK